MERILFIMGNMGLGGAETHIMKVYRQIDKARYQFDFVLNTPQKCYYEDEILGLGGKIYRVTAKSKSVIKNYKDIKKIVLEQHYRIVFKCGEQAMSWTEMLAAKQGGAIKRIMRSTNSKGGDSKVANMIHCLSRVPLGMLVTDRIAPSKVAGEWLFGKKGCQHLILMNNGLDLEEYTYTSEKRSAARAEFSIPQDAFVMGHVGRFNEQKNHDFLIDIFNAYYRESENGYLFLVGDGPLKNQIENKVDNLGLHDRVIFAGNRADVNILYSAMDAFVFPSFYEGMPNTVIEAQANGLPCFVSDTITTDANITGKVEYIKLGSCNSWVNAIKHGTLERYNSTAFFERAGYDIGSVVQQYVDIFEREK